ncbi:MAG: type IV pilus secretin PilQ family protein [Spongiibacteraceae bacterium]|jgi:type IV pilus assembly protein PilQ|nr:type IV pilus secretin PilQ family protein [Spongiibacteraceae bacterium]
MKNFFGAAIGRAGLLSCLLGFSGMLSAASLMDLEFHSLPGGAFEAKLVFDEPPPQPQGYSIERPARIALDFPGVTSKLASRRHTLGYENASSAVVIDADGRTRMVLNLVQLAPYSTRIEGNNLFVQVGDAGPREYLSPVVRSSAVDAVLAASDDNGVAGDAIRNLDFRRGDNGEGRLIITLADTQADVNAFVEGSRIKLELRGASLPERLQRRFDVTDFATPVKNIDARPTGNGATITLEATGEYDYLAYQADTEYVVSVKPLAPAEVEERRKEFAYTGERLSLNFQDIEVRAVLQIIADFTGLNLVASDTVNGRITLRLQNVPWDQALDLVLKTKGLDKRQIGNVLMVAPALEIAERERTELETRKQVQELAPLQTEHIRIRYASAEALFALFDPSQEGSTSLLSSRGRVIVDGRTNSLLVTETAQKLEEFRRIVKLLDVPIRQVLIEARIVIANSDFDKQLGIRWGGAYRADVNSGGLLEVGGSLDTIADDTPNVIEFPQALAVDLGVAEPTGSFAIGYTGSELLLNLELSALEAQGRGEIVSQPKVITGDKQQATIKSGTEVPYQESAANGETTIQFKEAVLKLDVTPSITPDDRIIMDLEINQDSVGELVPSGNGGFVPTIDTNAIKTQVLVGNGETIVLGGVFRTEDIYSTSKVPVLGDIPYVGRLFRNEQVDQARSEILIFITPRILADTVID